MKFSNNIKAGILDLPIFIIISFILAIFFVLMLYAQNVVYDIFLKIAPTIQENVANSTNVTSIITGTIGNTSIAFNSFKWISVMLIFGFLLSILISSFIIKTHPVWFIGHVFIVVISIILSVYISNAYETLMSNPTLSTTFLTGFFAQNWIFLHLPIWVAIIGFLSGIIMYVNLDTGGNYV